MSIEQQDGEDRDFYLLMIPREVYERLQRVSVGRNATVPALVQQAVRDFLRDAEGRSSPELLVETTAKGR